MEEEGEDSTCSLPYSPSPPVPPPSPTPLSSPPVAARSFSESLDDQGGNTLETHDDQGGHDGAVAHPSAVLTEDLREKIVCQVEYYLGDENLPTDKFLLKFVMKDKEGFVPIAVISAFRKMKKLAHDISLVEVALRTSSQLVVSLDGKKVKRLHPLLAVENAKSRTVLVENLLENYSRDSIQRIFSKVGNIKDISIRDPHAIEGSATINKEERVMSNKVHALVEYETVEAAENAVATLNDEKDWRNGMRVELLLKRLGKYGLVSGVGKGAFSEKKSNIEASVKLGDVQNKTSFDHYDKMAELEEREHFSGENNAKRGHNRRRGRGCRQHIVNGHGCGPVPSSSDGSGMCKPAPGPRMPDGTRGFTQGRGKAPAPAGT